MELVLLEGTLVPLPILEVLRPLAVEHPVVPVALELPMAALTIEHSPTALHSVSELPFIPAAIRPPEGTFSVPFASLELPLVNIAFLARPGIDASSFLLVEPELSNIVVPSREVEFALSFQLSVVEVPIDDLMGILEEAHPLSMRTVDLCFT